MPVPLDSERGHEDWLAPKLSAAGYTTLGVSSNPWISNKTAFDAGFDEFGALWQDAPARWAVRAGLRAGGRAERTWERFGVLAARLPGGIVNTPFFAFFNFIDPHQPYSAPNPEPFGGDPAEWDRLSPTGKSIEKQLLAGTLTLEPGHLDGLYDAEMHVVDQQLGVLVQWLKDEGVYDQTLLIVTADHGEHLGEDGRWSHQLSMADALLHVPLVVKLPGGERAGERVERPVSTRSVYASILDAAGVDGVRGPRLDDEGPVISEYYWSDAYLGGLEAVTSRFDATPHRAVHRVAVQDGLRVEMRDDAVVRAGREDGGIADAPEERAVLDELIGTLRRYSAEVEVPVRDSPDDAPVDAETELLEMLGYVGE